MDNQKKPRLIAPIVDKDLERKFCLGLVLGVLKSLIKCSFQCSADIGGDNISAKLLHQQMSYFR